MGFIPAIPELYMAIRYADGLFVNEAFLPL